MKASTMPRRAAYARSTSYSHYQSGQRGRQPTRTKSKTSSNRHGHAMVGLVLMMVIGLGVVVGFRSGSSVKPSQQPIISPSSHSSTPAAPATNHCADNTIDKFIKISISQRHLWACQGNKMVYDTPVITGIESHEETKTPVGTYHINSKITDTTLTGKDSTGSWSDPVSYWMPFLDNQHGTYGFHDATWRNDKEFGAVDPNSDQGSHGCIELPLGASKWLYNWAPVQSTVSIEN